ASPSPGFCFPAGSPLLRSVPAFAGLSSCHRHDEFAFGEPAAHPTAMGGDIAALASPPIANVGGLRKRWCKAPISTPSTSSGWGEIEALDVVSGDGRRRGVRLHAGSGPARPTRKPPS